MNMTIYEEVKSLYSQVGIDFVEDLRHYAEYGYIFSGQTYFLMGKQVGEGWYIQVAVGRNCLQKFLELMPFELPYVGWRRMKHGCEVRWHPTTSIRRRISYARRIEHTGA